METPDLPLDGFGFSDVEAALAARAAADTIYGPFFTDMTESAARGLSEGTLEPQVGKLALFAAATLYRDAGHFYKHFGYPRNGEPLSGDELEAHVEDVKAGEIKLVPEQSWTTAEAGRRQVQSASMLLGTMPSEVERKLAELNYRLYFNDLTMAGSTRTLREEESLFEQQGTEAMPHLQLSNWAIGRTVASLYEGLGRTRPASRLRVVDMGAGTGATSTAVLASIARTRDEIGSQHGVPDLSYLTLEATDDFQRILTHDLEARARESGLFAHIEAAASFEDVGEVGPGGLVMAYADAASAVRDGRLLADIPPTDIAVFVANYSMHRIPGARKLEMIEEMATTPNVVIVIGDLERNASPVNKGYFNLAANGPLNAGNLELARSLTKSGFELVNLNRTRPAQLDKVMAGKLVSPKDDKVFHIAYKGTIAEEALMAGSVAA